METLTKVQRGELRELIVQGCRELEEQLADSRESSKPVSLDVPIGRLSRMDALQQQQIAIAGGESLVRRLQLLRNALQAIGSDIYGTCRYCEEPIGYQRLKGRPETPFCLACQNRSEGER